MNIAITFRHIEPSEAVKKYAQEKIAKLQKFLRQPMQAQLTLDMERIEHVVEVRVSAGASITTARSRARTCTRRSTWWSTSSSGRSGAAKGSTWRKSAAPRAPDSSRPQRPWATKPNARSRNRTQIG